MARDPRDGFRTMSVGEIRAAIAGVPDDTPVLVDMIVDEGHVATGKVDDAGVVVTTGTPTGTMLKIVANAWDPDKQARLARSSDLGQDN